MMEQNTGDLHDDEEVLLGSSEAPVVYFERSPPFTSPIHLMDGGVYLDPPRWWESSPDEAVLDAPGRSGPRQNPTGTSLAKTQARPGANLACDAGIADR